MTTGVCTFLLVLLQAAPATAKDNIRFEVPSKTGTSVATTYSIDGATLVSRYTNFPPSRTTVKLVARGYSAKLKIRFEEWSVPAGVSVMISYPFSSISDRFVNSATMSGFTLPDRSKYATFEFHFYTSGFSDFNFNIIVTAVEDNYLCDEFRCSNGDCVDDDLRCDGVDHCFDLSDEMSGLGCPTKSSVTGLVIGGVIIIIIGVCIGVSVCVTCYCKKGGSHRRVVRQPAGGTPVVPTSTTAPPPGSVPATFQPTAYSLQPGTQPGYLNPYSPPAYTAPTSAAYPYGQVTGHSSDMGLPPAYESVVGTKNKSENSDK